MGFAGKWECPQRWMEFGCKVMLYIFSTSFLLCYEKTISSISLFSLVLEMGQLLLASKLALLPQGNRIMWEISLELMYANSEFWNRKYPKDFLHCNSTHNEMILGFMHTMGEWWQGSHSHKLNADVVRLLEVYFPQLIVMLITVPWPSGWGDRRKCRICVCMILPGRNTIHWSENCWYIK